MTDGTKKRGAVTHWCRVFAPSPTELRLSVACFRLFRCDLLLKRYDEFA